jgi:hypothetical protein
MIPTCFFSDIQEGKPWRRGWKGLWVSLAYTRAFGTLGLQFKSGQTHLPTLIHGNIDLSPWQASSYGQSMECDAK